MKKTTKKKAKRSVRKRLKNQLDNIFRDYVRLLEPCCFTSGVQHNLQCSHYFGRESLSTRWDLMNCHMQNAGEHHRYHTDNSEPYRRAIIEKYGQKAFNDLELRHNTSVKWSNEVLQEMITYYKEKIEELK